MKKLNKFEQYLLTEGLKMYSAALKAEIAEATAKGKNHLFTEGYVDSVSSEITAKLQGLTLK